MSKSILEEHTGFQIKVQSNFREGEEIAGSGGRVDRVFHLEWQKVGELECSDGHAGLRRRSEPG